MDRGGSQGAIRCGDESLRALQRRVGTLCAHRGGIAAASKNRPAGDATGARLAEFDAKLDALRKKIVATKEGGAITGEERLREHTDQLYGAITSWDGPPSAYQIDNTAALRAQLADIDAGF